MNYKELKQWLIEYKGEGVECVGCEDEKDCHALNNCEILCRKDADLIIKKIKELENES